MVDGRDRLFGGRHVFRGRRMLGVRGLSEVGAWSAVGA